MLCILMFLTWLPHTLCFFWIKFHTMYNTADYTGSYLTCSLTLFCLSVNSNTKVWQKAAWHSNTGHRHVNHWWFTINIQNKKCTLVQALRLCTGRMAHTGSRCIALPFLDHGSRRGWGVSVMPRPLFAPGKELVPIVQEAEWAPGPVWTGAENLAPTGIRSPNSPAHSQSPYRLRYLAHINIQSTILCTRSTVTD